MLLVIPAGEMIGVSREAARYVEVSECTGGSRSRSIAGRS
jgi:hypothetical protein